MSKTKKKTINDYLLKQITSVEDLKKNVRGMPLEECLNNLSLGLGDVRYLDIENPLITEPWNNYELVPELLVKMFRDPAYFHFFCKYVLNVELQPYQNCILRTLWHKPLPILLASRGAAKTFCLALYTILKLLFHPGCKVVVVGAGLRQSKLVFNYINTIYEKAPILRDIANDYPKERIDSCTWSVGYSEAIFIPLGNGEKIRGLRASTIICDEFSSISSEIFETVIRGFAAVKSEGLTYNIAEAYKKELFNKLGLPTDDQVVDKNILTDNQIILSGTPSYQFNHFYKYFSYYRDVITGEISSKGSKEYAEIIQKQIDPRDYAIIRIPYEVLPKGMMDEKILLQGKATMDPQIFMMEFQGCHHPDQLLLTKSGMKKISDIREGDYVLTHKNRFRKVYKVMARPVDEEIYNIHTYGSYLPIMITKNHPLWQLEENFDTAENLGNITYRSNLTELNGLQEIDLSILCSRVSIGTLEGVNYVYPAWNNRVKNHAIDRKYKSCIPQILKLDYNFGLVLGGYAAEGSVGSNGRAATLSLDGHTDKSLTDIVDTFKEAIFSVFGLHPKEYPYDSCLNLTITNRLVAEVLKLICPGRAKDKFVSPEILFSNEEFLRGFIKGYWLGDGHMSKEDLACACSTSKDLIGQLQLALSYFNIGSSLRHRDPTTCIFRGKEHNSSEAFELTIHGENLNRLCELLEIDDVSKRHSHYIKSYDTYSTFKVDNIETVHYNGLVYNLEVEEDHSYSLPNATVHNCFPSDSDGFFLASWVHKATAPVKIGNDLCTFKPKLYCDPSSSCVMGVDPASEDDRFAVCIMELMGPVRGVVYVWSTTRKEFEQLKRDGLIANDIDDYNTFCVKHIRHLVKRFNVKMVVMDAGGGGLAIKEGLKDKTKLLDSTDSPILDMDDENSQGLHGEHILKMIQFQNNEWRVNSHHGLRKDILDMKVLFPEYDGAAIESGNVHDSITGKVFDTAEGCYYEIEQCKQETILIRHSRTVNGAEKWDVPKIMGLDAEHVRKQLKRDRFTALLLANWGCRLVQEELPYDGEAFTGGSAKDMKGDMSGLPYVGRGVGRLKGANSLCVTSVKATETSYGSGRKIVY